jgi:2'-5' RNA ligase
MKFLMKYDNYKSLNEKKEDKDTEKIYEYGCAMLYFDFPEMDEFHSQIDENDIYSEDGHGLETEPHTTLLYGFHADEIEDDNEIIETITEEEIPELELYNVSIFENDDYDVLKFDVRQKMDEYDKDEDILYKINKKLTDKFPYSSDYPDYHPHATIGYLKKGEAGKYVEKFKDKIYSVIPKEIVYSKPTEDGKDKTQIKKEI